MNKGWLLALALAAVLSLAACGGTAGEETEPETPPQDTVTTEALEALVGEAASETPPVPEEGVELYDGQYLQRIDWESFQGRVTEAEYAAIEKYLPQLTGGEFTWIYRSGEGGKPDTYTHGRKQTTIQQMVTELQAENDLEPQAAEVDSILFADLFQTGEKNVCLLLRHLGWYWLILHEEGGVVYGIDMPVRWFEAVQDNGVYLGSGGADHSYYHRMTFAGGDYGEEDLGEVIRSWNDASGTASSTLYIGGAAQPEEVYRAWREQYLREAVPWYAPADGSVR